MPRSPRQVRLECKAFHYSLLANLVENLHNCIPLRQFEICERINLKHQRPQFVTGFLGMQRAMGGRNILNAMRALRELVTRAAY